MARTHLKKQSPINGLANRGRVVRPIAMKGKEVPYLRGLLALFGPRRGERCVHFIGAGEGVAIFSIMQGTRHGLILIRGRGSNPPPQPTPPRGGGV
jgi:hypothetical protein